MKHVVLQTFLKYLSEVQKSKKFSLQITEQKPQERKFRLH
jgi:hypothetical protein